MNYLAHAVLAKPNSYSLVGNLLGDFCKGVDTASLHPQVRAGLHNHRATDRFTDQHAIVKAAKAGFSARRRRFAAVALDVLFDHFLIRHWQQFYAEPFADYKSRLYCQLNDAMPLMPATMRDTMQRVCRNDWFASYQQLATVGQALDHIASRIRFANNFAGIVEEISPRYSRLEQDFLQFYPQLQCHLRQLALEH
ncbi:ACP phosphodiesterase [Arsukibacterium sp.]|uniref:acyl carrier protein phosphodiesterase n=1 Tax=Arsukibacterium sp. TaxID=1977258 RepID=UPI00299D42D8|nr:ACP phosphodiesterase [Arsukibacterium sp.]MDX1676708.1 ACP phosphodiesterase [Arsukibacterium sp.]